MAVLRAVMVAGGAAIIAGMLGFGGVLFDVGHPEQSGYAQLLKRLGVAHFEKPRP